MLQSKQPAVSKTCKHCGRELRGKYAAKTHICAEQRRIESREEGLAKQRSEGHGKA